MVEEEEDKRNWLRPLEKVFDLLQRGQYISANVANTLFQTLQGKAPEDRQSFMEAVRTGATGEVKGSYEDVIRDTLGVGTRKVFGGAPEGTRRAQMDWADVLGFVGDILLDPLTYMSFGGAAKGATKAAGEFADDSVRLFLRQMSKDPTELAKLTRGSITPQEVVGALSEGTEKAIKHLQGKGGDLARVIDKTYQEAYRRGLRQTQETLIKETSGVLDNIGGDGLEDIVTRLDAGSAYQGAGTTFGSRFMTREYEGLPFVSARGARQEAGLTKIRRDTFDRFANFYRDSKVGSKFSDAVWGIMNKGKVGEIRRALGIRNPYQKYLRAKELNAVKTSEIAQNIAAQDVLQPIRDLDEDQLNKLYRTMSRREDAASNVVNAAETPSQRLFGGVFNSDDEAVNEAANALEGVLSKWKAQEDMWAQRLGEEVADAREYYLPKIDRFRKRGSNPRAQRQRTYSQSFDREVELTKVVYGVDDDLARELVQADATGLGVDIREAMIERAMIHGRAEGRFNLVQQIREMGIDMRDSLDPAAAAFKTRGRSINELGLKTVDSQALEGFVFDEDVANIAQRALNISGKDKNVFQKMMAKYATWWKGVVLATTGYHARNFMTNTMIQFLHHGPRAFKKDEIMESAAAVWYVLKKTNPRVNLDDFLKEVGLEEGNMAKLLNHRKGNLTIRELAEQAYQRNVISQSTMGYDRRSVLEAFEGKGSKPIRSASRAVGNYVENIPRFQSFMIDYADNATADLSKLKPGDLVEVEKPALDFAGMEAKKYFLDYEDLTDFERDTLKNVIPFYTFLRKNLGAQLSALALYPEMYSLIPKIENFIEYEDPDYDRSLIPDWMRNEGMFALRRADADLGLIGRAMESVGIDMEGGEGFRFFRPDFAYNDLNLIPLQWDEGDWRPKFNGQELKDQLINATAPWLRRAADAMMDTDNAYNFFYQGDLQPTSEAPYLMRLFASRPEVVPFVDGLLRMAGYSDGAKISETDGKLEIDSRMALLLEEFLPVLRQGAYLFYLADDIPFVENVINEHLMVEDEYEGAEEVLQNLSFWLGIKMRDQDLETEKQRVASDIYYEARNVLNEQRRDRPGAEQRQLEARNRTQESIRRLR